MTVLACSVAAAMGVVFAYQDSAASTEREVIAMERASMDGWLKGDSAPNAGGVRRRHYDVPRDDSAAARWHCRGKGSLRALRRPAALRQLPDREAKVQASGDMAILSYRLVTQNGADARTWNATEVYQKKKAGWRVIHSHFSQVGGAPQ
ncbi:MAG: nuclear transport factor 2 family protein [Ignavibacteriota bacterium]